MSYKIQRVPKRYSRRRIYQFLKRFFGLVLLVLEIVKKVFDLIK